MDIPVAAEGGGRGVAGPNRSTLKASRLCDARYLFGEKADQATTGNHRRGMAHAGHKTDLAESLLHAMEHSLHAFEQHREVVLRWLKGAR
jgi:hypothetical protein